MYKLKLIINIEENSTEEKKKYIAYIGKEDYVGFGKSKEQALNALIKELKTNNLFEEDIK